MWLAGTERSKLSLALLAVAVLLVGGVALATANERAYRADRERETRVQADILAASVTASLAFDDRRAAQGYIDALSVNPQLQAAAIYDLRGEAFASFTRRGTALAPPPPGLRWIRGGRLQIVRPVTENGTSLGRVYLATVPEPIAMTLTRHGGTALLVVMAMMFLALLGRAYTALDRRAAELVRVNEDLRREALERERAEEALLQAKKMEALGQLTGGIAHDFNNLLQAMQGGFDLIRRAPEDFKRVARLADVGLQASERGHKLTSQLLAFSRASQLQLQPLLVGEVIEGMSSLLSSTVGPLVEVRCELDAPPIRVLADPTQLEMAVLNVAVNARDAMPEGGLLTVRLRLREVTGDPELEDDLYLELSIADTGPGMGPEVRARAFEPFFTTKGVGHGTGLGLAQVYAMARQSGGTARIASAPGEGATVSLILRQARDQAAAATVEAETADVVPHPAVARTILVVDDDTEVRALLGELLGALGHKVIEAADGPSALDLLSNGPPDLMLVDFAMPGMNGAELASAALSLWPGLPIVFASGYADIAQVETAVGPRASIIRKPFTLEVLNGAIERAAREAAA
ncbi:MAG TPA: ATP-binding protein [Caulobacteraceae bacterium]|jgi:signal transduction histidine kinase|nr:ATP-binding protein [Caulobacteraceae bacterium]